MIMVQDTGGFAMHDRWGRDYFSTKGLCKTLMPKADAKYRKLLMQFLNGCQGNAGILWGFGSGRDYQMIRLQLTNTGQVYFIVLVDQDVLAQTLEILNQIVGKRIVIVD